MFVPNSIRPSYSNLAPTNSSRRGYSQRFQLETELQVRPRSGLAFKHGITVLNAPGTIDADYRGEIGVLLINHGVKAFTIENGERIAQLVLARYERIAWQETDTLPETDRGAGGFGSTGTH